MDQIFNYSWRLLGFLCLSCIVALPLSAQDSPSIGLDKTMLDKTMNDITKTSPGQCTLESSACGMPKDELELRKLLSPEQYRIVRENGTERPFQNAYWDNKKEGIYVDVVSGEPLFSSIDKFDSGTGWPSFTKPINASSVIEKTDLSHGMKRVEVRSQKADSHLGHIFDDGPAPSKMRYCINSASLKFIPRTELSQKGYAEYEKLFR